MVKSTSLSKGTSVNIIKLPTGHRFVVGTIAAWHPTKDHRATIVYLVGGGNMYVPLTVPEFEGYL